MAIFGCALALIGEAPAGPRCGAGAESSKWTSVGLRTAPSALGDEICNSQTAGPAEQTRAFVRHQSGSSVTHVRAWSRLMVSNVPFAPYPLPLWERVDASEASGRVRGSFPTPPHPPRSQGLARHPLPQGERVTEFASLQEVSVAPSPLHLPGRRAVLFVFELNAHCPELITNAIGLTEVLRLAGGVARVDQRRDLFFIHFTTL